ncbi:SgcJ/EcaC family oxidoreductase [Nocardiopsis dassonvillei]|uniref:SgcJ/EcaC family oxidoreductase n=1 Tax=Nocardiopsis dassonvillei TaxID=2014 RepID=UPI003637709D
MSDTEQTEGRTGTRRAGAHAEIHALVRSLQDAFNAHDPVALADHYAGDALWASAAGRRMAGSARIAEFAREVAPMLADSYARYEVANLLEIRPDVIAVQVAQTAVDAGGEPTGAPAGSALYVCARGEDGWRISAGQNMIVAP